MFSLRRKLVIAAMLITGLAMMILPMVLRP